MSSLPDPISERHAEVLRAAMRLVAERGLAGASLRALAGRVGMSQPSLYHYFDSKDELIRQIIEHHTRTVLRLPDPPPVLDSIEDLVSAVCQYVLGLYSLEDHVSFVRFLFVVTLEQAAWQDVLRNRFIDGWREDFRRIAAPLVARGDLAQDDVEYAGHLISSPMLVEMLNDRVLLREPMEVTRWIPQIEFLAETLGAGLRARATRLNAERDRA